MSEAILFGSSLKVEKPSRLLLQIEPTHGTVSGNLQASDVSCYTTDEIVEERRRDRLSVDIKEEPIVVPGYNIDIHSQSSNAYGGSTAFHVATKSVSIQTTDDYPAIEGFTATIDRLNNQIADLKRKLSQAEKAKACAEKAKADAEKTRAKSQLPLVIFEQQLETNAEMCKFYTGFDVNQLKAVKLFSAVEKIQYWGGTSVNESHTTDSSSSKPPGRTRNFTHEQELLLFFLRMRGGFLLEDIAYRFNLSPSFVSRIVVTWTQILFKKFDSVRPYMFPSRHLINKHLPERFKKFKNIRVIIDCAQIRCEKSSSFEQQGNCYSEYKAHTTFKFLIGCTPNGAVSFVSHLMEGSIHDRAIVEQSGLVELLEEGDLVLADRGFTIRDLTDEKGAVLKIPAFLKGRDKLTPQEEVETKQIAASRIFIEHVVGRLKTFRIFQRVVPMSMRPILSQAVFVCACLLNFHEPLVE